MKILVLVSRIPYPLEKGDKLRAFNHIKYLSKSHSIYLVALNTEKIHPEAINILKTYCKETHIININKLCIFFSLVKSIFTLLPFQLAWFYNKKAQNKINNLIDEIKPEHIFCQLIRVSEYVKNVDIPKTLDYQDTFSIGFKRRSQYSPFYLKPIFIIEYKRLKKYEREIFPFFNNKVIISKPDREFIDHPEKDKIYIIPNGVDSEYYQLQENSFKEYELLFTGNMQYYPNVVSVLYLVNEILPKLIGLYPGIKVVIAGANPHKKIRELQSDRVIITGWVDDLRIYYARSKVFIAPMLIGTGLQNKLLEAMSMHLPCITSSLVNQALEAENNSEILVCNTTEDYVQNIKLLLDNPEKYKQLASNGYDFIIKKHNWETLTKKLEETIKNSYL